MKTSGAVHELFLNYACTARCPFCYNPPLTAELLRLDLSLKQAAGSLVAAARSGAKRLNLHGGEVTLREDLPTILGLARRLGFSDITLVTNGVRLSDPIYVSRLVRAGLTRVRLSVHAAEAALHDEVVGIPGAFERVASAESNLRAAGIPSGMNFVLIRRNHGQLEAFVRRFVLDGQVRDVIVYFPHFRGMMALNAASDGVAYSDVRASISAAAAALESAGRLDSLWLANFPPCAAPELAERMLDWERDHDVGSSMVHPEGHGSDLAGMKAGQKTSVAACERCSLGRRCLGVDREYVARFGEVGLRALEAVVS